MLIVMNSDPSASQLRQESSANSSLLSFSRRSCVELRQNTSGMSFLYACCFMAHIIVQYHHQPGANRNRAPGNSWLSAIPVFDAPQAVREEFPL